MTRGDCPACGGTGRVVAANTGHIVCLACHGTGLSAESLDAFHEELDALSRAALTPWPPKDQA